ncbi:outer membrane lipoprotein carrier protein LolA [Leptothrix discophora]|uniref:Outer membrane lipoprotein carrier protein LolA n=1 Tax=Leptothrix discophora TaxID=89 RepID=A0ABT9G8V6_LEPDI|nr:outer membrane lipoprotein carrier protein LolA [Leptothrix discophora]MDP4302914.1 outer membrane lipoprotein carrier protein LolA [Leptothrix discophora]
MRRPDRRHAVRAWLGASLLALAGPGWAFGLEDLMRTLASVREGEASFTEKRTVAQLDQPLVSSGRLSFTAPDRFERVTLKPRREALQVNGNTLTMSQGSRSRTLALDAVPEAQIMVEAVRGTLTGNQAALQKYFSTQVGGAAERWSLDLKPLDVKLRGTIAAIRVSGRQAEVQEIVLELADGDRSVMKIEPAMVSR